MPPRSSASRAMVLLAGTAVGFLLLPSRPLGAQARRPLPPDHWSYSLQEALHALGVSGSETLLVRSATGAAHLRLMEMSLEEAWGEGPLPSLLRSWGGRLGREVGAWDPQAGLRRGGSSPTPAAGLLLDAALGWSDDPSLPVSSRDGFAGLLVAGELGPGVSFWADGELATAKGGKALRSAGIGFQVKSFDLLFGRVPMALGQGTDPILMNGRKPSAGVFLTSRDPFRLPGALSGLGPFRLHAGLSPFISTPGASSAWLGSYALTWSPHPRMELGASRTTRFAGKGIQGFDVQDFFRMLVGQGKADSFDDSQGELAGRVRWAILGQPLATYLSLGFEDKTTAWKDPALLLGVLLPHLRPEALYTLRYEFLAFGPRARWCSSCESWEGDLWYFHPTFGPYVLEGEPLGSLLGGNGASHTVRLEGWLTAMPLRGWLEYRRMDRGPENAMRSPEATRAGFPPGVSDWTLLPEPAPSRVRSWAIGAEALSRKGLGFSAAVHTARLDGRREWGLSLALRALLSGGE